MDEIWNLTTGAVARAASSTHATVGKYAAAGLIEYRLASNGMRLFRQDAPDRVRAIKVQHLAKRGRRSRIEV